ILFRAYQFFYKWLCSRLTFKKTIFFFRRKKKIPAIIWHTPKNNFWHITSRVSPAFNIDIFSLHKVWIDMRHFSFLIFSSYVFVFIYVLPFYIKISKTHDYTIDCRDTGGIVGPFECLMGEMNNNIEIFKILPEQPDLLTL